MGTDIHMIGERKSWQGRWVPFPIPDKFQSRYYAFFAALADIRNGYGCAGVYSHERAAPLTSGRGWPDDVSSVAKLWYTDKLPEGIEQVFGYPGDHSPGYATLTELKAHNFTQSVIQGGVLSEAEYAAWDRVSAPSSYCGGVSGGSVVQVTEEQYVKKDYPEGMDIYVAVRWKAPLVDHAFITDFLTFLEQWKEWGAKTDEGVRVLFDFDS